MKKIIEMLKDNPIKFIFDLGIRVLIIYMILIAFILLIMEIRCTV